MKKNRSALLFLLSLYGALCYTQPASLEFIRKNTEDGLSQSVVHSLCRDAKGFVWIGTQDGLNRFDAYSFHTFETQPDRPGNLKHSYIWTLHQSGLQEQELWIGTNGGGLYCYDHRLDWFYHYPVPDSLQYSSRSNSVRAIHAFSKSELLAGTEDGLFLFNFDKKTFTQLPHEFLGSVFTFHQLSNEAILIGGLERVFYFKPEDQSLRLLHLSRKIEGGIHSFAGLNENSFWLGTGKGVYEVQLKRKRDSLIVLNHYVHSDMESTSLSNNSIADLHLDTNGKLWIASNGGINVLDTRNRATGFVRYQHSADDQQSVSSDIINCLEEVEKGVLWAGTQNGLNQFSSQKSVFTNFEIDQTNEGCGQSIHGMLETEAFVLACTEKGLLSIDPEMKGITNCYDQGVFPALEDEFLVSISPGKEDNYWLALRRNGFAELRKENDTFHLSNFKLPAGPYSGIGSNDLLEDDSGNLWIASSGLGLWYWNRQENTFVSYKANPEDSTSISGNYIFHLFEDRQKRVWVSTADGGLSCLDRESGIFKSFSFDERNSSSLSANMVLSTYEDRQNRIWVCTANGLNLWDGEEGFFRFYKKDGLPNNVIYGMLEDANGALWLSTGKGLAQISYTGQLFKSKNYTTLNGLLNNEFNQHAFLKLRNGNLTFGTKGGLSYFNPDSIRSYAIAPRVVLTDFKLFNESVPVNQKEGFSIPKSVDELKQLTLSYEQNFLAFEFTGINYEQAQANQYAYMMEGLDEDWVFSGNRRYANYPGMKPGPYVFKVKSANHDGLWSEERALKILIRNPPWKSWWAYLLYAISILSLIWYRLYSVRQIEKAKEAERQLIRKRSAQDFHDEAGNQITKIGLMAEMAKRQVGDRGELDRLMNEIGEQVQELRTGMRDFIWVLDPGKDNLYETLMRLNDFGNGLFNYSTIHFSSSGINEDLNRYKLNAAQRRHTLMIFKEAMNNSVKYSQGKQATLNVLEKNAFIEISFEDDGIGYSATDARHGHGIQNMKARAEKINAKLEITSNKPVGTRLIIILNTTHMGN